MRKAMINHCISVEPTPMSNKQKKQSAVVMQNGNFVGIAKKRNPGLSLSPAYNISLALVPYAPSNSDNEPQEQAYSIKMVKRKPKAISQI